MLEKLKPFSHFDDINSDIALHCEDGFGYATFSLAHFCFVTLRATTSIDLARRRGYCICPMFPRLMLDEGIVGAVYIHTFHFCVTYYMKPCLEAIKEITKKGHTLKSNLLKRFQMRNSIRATLINEDKDLCGWKVSFDFADHNGSQMISAESIDYWRKDQEELEMEMETFHFPPSFQISAISQNATESIFIKLKFDLNLANETFYIQLPLMCFQSKSSANGKLFPNPVCVGEKLTIDELIIKAELNHSHLTQRIEDQDLSKLASFFDSDTIEDCIEQFSLTSAQRADIRSIVDTKKRAREALRLWRQQNPFHATFEVLLTFLLDLRKGDIACQICDYLKK